MLKVVQIIPNLANGGAEKFVFDMCKNIDKSKFDLMLILLYDGENSKYYDELIDLGINIVCIRKKIGFKLNVFGKIIKIIKKFKPDVIHSHLAVNLYLLPYYIFNRKQVGYHTVHNLALNEQSSLYRKIMDYLYKHRQVKPVAISNVVCDSISSCYSIDAELVSTIYNGIDTSIYTREIRSESSDIIKFVAVGRLMSQKNYPLMINAFAEAFQINNNIRLDILGEGELREELTCLISNQLLENVVQLKGNVPNVKDYLQGADCFLMSSDYEGLPLSVLEAMSCGLSIVSTKAGGVIDVVSDGVNGYLSEVGDVKELVGNIIAIISDDNLARFGDASFELSRQYDIKDCVLKYENLFQSKFK